MASFFSCLWASASFVLPGHYGSRPPLQPRLAANAAGFFSAALAASWGEKVGTDAPRLVTWASRGFLAVTLALLALGLVGSIISALLVAMLNSVPTPASAWSSHRHRYGADDMAKTQKNPQGLAHRLRPCCRCWPAVYDHSLPQPAVLNGTRCRWSAGHLRWPSACICRHDASPTSPHPGSASACVNGPV